VNLEDWCRLNVGWTGEVAMSLCAGVRAGGLRTALSMYV
jgi:hypothetical protein